MSQEIEPFPLKKTPEIVQNITQNPKITANLTLHDQPATSSASLNLSRRDPTRFALNHPCSQEPSDNLVAHNVSRVCRLWYGHLLVSAMVFVSIWNGFFREFLLRQGLNLGPILREATNRRPATRIFRPMQHFRVGCRLRCPSGAQI